MSNQKNLYPSVSEVTNVLTNCEAVAEQNLAYTNQIQFQKEK